MQKNFIFSLFFILFICACQTKVRLPQLSDEEQFVKYWFTGNAEVNSYELVQARYGAMHKGEVVMVYVTEDFRIDKQVKLDGDAQRSQTATMLKLNTIRRFTTGIYDYSAMTSVFMPVSTNDFRNALKISTSVQDWCGQSFMQLNFRQNGYHVMGHSYFEAFADQNFHIDKGTPEDELFNAIRLRPNSLDLGDKMMIPSLLSQRFRHKKPTPILANLKLYDYKDNFYTGNKLKVYEIDYRGDARNLKIIYENLFPYRIIGFEETYKEKDVFMTTRAKLKKNLLTPYWQEHMPSDSTKRKELMLGY